VTAIPDASARHLDGVRGPHRETPDAVVVGAVTRDLTPDDPRGWRLGGAVAYAALTIANLGLRTAAILGADDSAAGAAELDLMRGAGVRLEIVPLGRGPIFENLETSAGRVQRCVQLSDPIPATAAGRITDAVASPQGWLLAPVADELPATWATGVPDEAYVGLGWQGLLRRLTEGQPVAPRSPEPSALLTRADLVGVSEDDLSPGTRLADLVALSEPAPRWSSRTAPEEGFSPTHRAVRAVSARCADTRPLPPRLPWTRPAQATFSWPRSSPRALSRACSAAAPTGASTSCSPPQPPR